MIKILVYTVLLCAIFVQCQDWSRLACLVGHNDYYAKIMQGIFTQIENDIKWCNMPMLNRRQVVNQRLYKWHATGTVNYTDNFVVSIEKIDLTDVKGDVTTFSLNGTQTSVQTVRGQVNLREITIGSDVIVNLDDSGIHYSTGEFTHELVSFDTLIRWSPSDGELSTTANIKSVSAGHRRMEYRPANNITEVVSRVFHASDHYDSFNSWARDIFAPRMLQIAKNLQFPTVRFDGRC